MIKHIFTLLWNKKRSNFLLFLEIFLSFLVLFAVFTFVFFNMRTYTTPLGFETKNIWMAKLVIPEAQDSLEAATIKEVLKRELENKPEIISTSFGAHISPFSGNGWSTDNEDNGFNLETYLFKADHNYLSTAGLSLLEGRWFEEEDKNAKYEPVVISRQMRDLYFSDRLFMDSIFQINGECKIIGVIDHFKYQGEFRKEENMTFYYEAYQNKDMGTLYIKLEDGVGPDFEEEVNKTIAEVTKRNDFIIESMENRRIKSSRKTWIPIVAMLCISIFLILNVALGLFGVLWYNISKRRSEIGLRRTLGASQANISMQFMGEIMMVTLFGILIGSFFTLQFPLLKLLEIDNINYYYAMLAAAGTIIPLVLICTFYPSRQAAQIQPAIALHEE